MDRETLKPPVSLTITKDGDLTFTGQCSEYEITNILEIWQKTQLAKRRHDKVISALVYWANWLGRFSSLLPLVLVLLVVVLGFKQCQSTPPQPIHPTQQYGGWQYGN